MHAFAAHLIKSLPPADRLYQWSNRTIPALAERDKSIDEVRLEMTAFCSRRVDYYLNATGRSALVTLSASWNLVQLFDCPEAQKDPSLVVNQIDAFERLHGKGEVGGRVDRALPSGGCAGRAGPGQATLRGKAAARLCGPPDQVAAPGRPPVPVEQPHDPGAG